MCVQLFVQDVLHTHPIRLVLANESIAASGSPLSLCNCLLRQVAIKRHGQIRWVGRQLGQIGHYACPLDNNPSNDCSRIDAVAMLVP